MSTRKRKKRVDPILRKARSMRSSLLKYGIKDWDVQTLVGMLSVPIKCPYCGLDPVPIRRLSIDHIMPRSLGGADHICNIHFTCLRCNRAKGNLTDHQFKQLLEWCREHPEIGNNILGRLRAGGYIYGRKN